MAKLLIMCVQESDLSSLLAACFSEHTKIGLNEQTDFETYDSFAILGGTELAPPALLPRIREALYLQRQKGKKVFCEYTAGVGEACFANPVPTNYDRPVFMKAQGSAGDVLDEQNNTRVPVQFLPKTADVWYQYAARPDGYRKAPLPERRDWDAALFEEAPGLLQCAFRMCNFAKARFAPFEAWKNLLAQIIAYLDGCWNEEIADELKKENYSFAGKQSVRQAAERAVQWFEHSGVLDIDRSSGLPRAVHEGISSVILADGTQHYATQIRLDCMGETALMYELRYQLYHNKRDRLCADSLFDTVRSMQYQTGRHKGMVRGSLGWWGNASYQDDAARGFLLPLAARAFLTRDMQDSAILRLALDYLLSTTGTDGLRVNQVNWQSTETEDVQVARLEWNGCKWKNSGFYSTTISKLSSTPAQNPSGHYNGWYLAALILCGLLLNEPRYIEAGQKGITSIMKQYPWTAREHSQTQEICRLILPVSLLVKVLPSTEHAEWLKQLTNDLCKLEIVPGAFAEYDDGYTASCSRSVTGECSVFANNGDPVCDFLYSMNWLLVSLAAAWYATRSETYCVLFKRTATFISSVQIESPNPKLHGAWARAVDAETLEVHGVNNDREWSTWTIESGWTVAEITNGMMWGLFTGMIEE